MVKTFTLRGKAYIVVAAPGRLCRGCAFAGLPCPRINHTTDTIGTDDEGFYGKPTVCIGHSMNHIAREAG